MLHSRRLSRGSLHPNVVSLYPNLARYVQLVRFSFLILIGCFVTLEP